MVNVGKYIIHVSYAYIYTLENSRFEPKVMALDGSNDFPFQMGWFLGSSCEFSGV